MRFLRANRDYIHDSAYHQVLTNGKVYDVTAQGGTWIQITDDHGDPHLFTMVRLSEFFYTPLEYYEPTTHTPQVVLDAEFEEFFPSWETVLNETAIKDMLDRNDNLQEAYFTAILSYLEYTFETPSRKIS